MTVHIIMIAMGSNPRNDGGYILGMLFCRWDIICLI